MSRMLDYSIGVRPLIFVDTGSSADMDGIEAIRYNKRHLLHQIRHLEATGSIIQ